jgi:hypothetical protein
MDHKIAVRVLTSSLCMKAGSPSAFYLYTVVFNPISLEKSTLFLNKCQFFYQQAISELERWRW